MRALLLFFFFFEISEAAQIKTKSFVYIKKKEIAKKLGNIFYYITTEKK